MAARLIFASQRRTEMADSARLSVAHFLRAFCKSTGESPHQFVLRHRIERARAVVRARSPLLDAPLAWGFKTQQHFARMFRRMCGASLQNIGTPICPVRSVRPIRHKSQRVASWHVMIKSFNKASCNLPYRTSGALRLSGTTCTSGSSLLDVSATDPRFLGISTNSGPM